jgi:hypothetical protein
MPRPRLQRAATARREKVQLHIREQSFLGHVVRETTSRGLCGLVCPSRTSERGGEG